MYTIYTRYIHTSEREKSLKRKPMIFGERGGSRRERIPYIIQCAFSLVPLSDLIQLGHKTQNADCP